MNAAELLALTRADLNATAAKRGVEAPDTLPNKQAVVDAILAHQAGPAPRSFRLKPGDVTRVSFGASPRISIGADDEPFATTDPRLAARLAANPQFEEVTPA